MESISSKTGNVAQRFTQNVAKFLFDKPKQSRFLQKEMNDVPKRILWIVPFHRYMMFVAAFVLQTCHGTQYAWPTITRYASKYIGSKAPEDFVRASNLLPAVFQLATWTACCIQIVAGPLILRYGPRVMTTISALAVTFSFLLSGLSLKFGSTLGLKLAGVFLGNGLLTGIGIGLGNTAVIMSMQRYFPDHLGIAVGVAASGLAVSSFLAYAVEAMVDLAGLQVPETFFVFAGIFAALMLPLTQLMQFPPSDFTGAEYFKAKLAKEEENGTYEGSAAPQTDELKQSQNQCKETRDKIIEKGLEEMYPTSRKALASWMFFAQAFVFYGSIIPGQFFMSRAAMLISNAKTNKGYDVNVNVNSEVILATVITGIGSLFGRLVLAPVSHRVGPFVVYFMCCAIQIIALGCLQFCIKGGFVEAIYGLLFVLSAMYGYAFAGVAISLIKLFSRKWLDLLYPLSLFAIFPGNAVSTLFSALHSDQNVIEDHMYYALVVVSIAGIFSIILGRKQRLQTNVILNSSKVVDVC